MVPNVKIGVLQEDKLINEIVVDKPQDISIGTTLENTITISDDNFPGEFLLLSYSEGKYYLNVHESMSGTIFEEDKTFSVKDMAGQSLPLSNNVRGSLVFGQNTILFKIYLSEEVPKRLPKEFKGRILTDFDFSFFVILVVFFLAYSMLVSTFGRFKPTEKIVFEEIPKRFARLILDKPITVEKKKKKKRFVDLGKKYRRKRKIRRGTRRAGGGAVDKRSAADVVRTAGIIGIIGSKGRGGKVANLFHEEGFGQKLDEALRGVSGLHVGASIEEARMKRGTGIAKGIDIGKLKTTTGSGATAFGERNVSAIDILGDIGKGDIEGSGSIDPAAIAKILARHVGAFQYCYNKALRGNPRLSGELRVRFTILSGGSVNRHNIGFRGTASRDMNLTTCIRRVFLRIRFPSPLGGEVTVGSPLNFTAQT